MLLNYNFIYDCIYDFSYWMIGSRFDHVESADTQKFIMHVALEIDLFITPT